MVKGVRVGENRSRVGLVVFSDEVTVEFTLDQQVLKLFMTLVDFAFILEHNSFPRKIRLHRKKLCDGMLSGLNLEKATYPVKILLMLCLEFVEGNRVA